MSRDKLHSLLYLRCMSVVHANDDAMRSFALQASFDLLAPFVETAGNLVIESSCNE